MSRYSTGPYNPDQLQGADGRQGDEGGDTRMGMMDGSQLASAGGQSLDEIVTQNSESAIRNQAYSTMAFGNNAAGIDSAMEDYGSQPNVGVNRVHYDPSLTGAMDTTMIGNIQPQIGLESQQNQANAAPRLSLDTQYQSQMDFSGLPQPNAAYHSSLDLDLTSPFLNSAGPMPLAMDFMNSADMNSINDFFASHNFDSPLMTSPMASTFGQSMYGPSQDAGGDAMEPADQLAVVQEQVDDTPETEMKASSSSVIQSLSRSGQPQAAQPLSLPPRTNVSSGTSKSRNSGGPAVIGGITLPWTDPPSGWPSTMQGSKPHMETPYRDAYAPSGFDLMTTLIRVAKRENPQINIGMVDLSCAFVVCDAKTHDTPIVYCSDSFERLTGYTKFEIQGQNCRFLQSPDGKVEPGVKRRYCDDDSAFYLKNCITIREEAQISLINYRKGGQPFMNLLTMIPITDDDGEIHQFVGFQVDLVENPHAVSSTNPDGTYSMNYSRKDSLPPYLLAVPEPNLVSEYGQTIPRDEVSVVLGTIGTSENDYSKRLMDKILLENSDDVIHVLSLKGLFLYLSPSCRKVLEYDASDLVGTALSSVCHPSDIVPVTRELKDTQNGTAISVVFRIRRKHSGYMWFESHGALHTEHGKGRKCIILVGRERPVYTLSKSMVASQGGIGENEMWTKMSTTGMFLFVSSHARYLLDRLPEELMGTNIQSLMRPDSKQDFNRILGLAMVGKNASVRHEMTNRRGQVLQAFSWLYPGDAVEGQKPTFIIAQTRLLKYHRGSLVNPPEASSPSDTIQPMASVNLSASMQDGNIGGLTPLSQLSSAASSTTELAYKSTPGIVMSQAGANAMPIGRQDVSLASDDNSFDELKTTRSTSWQFELRQMEKRNRMLHEEVQSLLTAKRKRKRRRGAGLLQKDCANCHTKDTPEWRRGPSGNRDLCNSCGLRWAKSQGRGSPHQSVSSASKASASPIQASEKFHYANAATQLSIAQTLSQADKPFSPHHPTPDPLSQNPKQTRTPTGHEPQASGSLTDVSSTIPDKPVDSMEPTEPDVETGRESTR